ncbi:MAG: sugar phosphate nucleotidyltransferase [Deltaproteobacteria bacterium]
MPVVLLCGGKGMRLGELTHKVPKPLIPVGERPILRHVMDIYAAQGVRRFILCLGYKKEVVRSYFRRRTPAGWDITFLDTGLEASKSERLLRAAAHVGCDDFFIAYGDDVADIDIRRLLACHRRGGCPVTITAVRLVSEFGVLRLDKGGRVTRFEEKPRLQEWMNGGFMVARKSIFSLLKGEFEEDVLRALARQGKVQAYKHRGRWKAMNTLKDYMELNRLWESGKAFWRIKEGTRHV